MKLTSTIKVEGEVEKLRKIFAAEKQAAKNKRASYKIKTKNSEFLIELKATDKTVLKAMTNSVSKLAKIYQKTRAMIKNEQKK